MEEKMIELTSKKNVLDYIIEVSKDKENINSEDMQEIYNNIYKSIDKMDVKVNTKMFLKNNLKSQLGKLVTDKDPKEVNHFIEFFKMAYPAGQRKKDFTWVLMDINKITEEQIWNTLTYINAWCLKDKSNRLSKEQKDDIIRMVEVLVKRNKLKYINQLKSLEKLQNTLNIKIVSANEKFKVKKLS